MDSEAKYQIGDTIISHLNISGTIVNRIFNEASGEWVYFCENMSVKESNIRESRAKDNYKKKKK